MSDFRKKNSSLENKRAMVDTYKKMLLSALMSAEKLNKGVSDSEQLEGARNSLASTIDCAFQLFDQATTDYLEELQGADFMLSGSRNYLMKEACDDQNDLLDAVKQYKATLNSSNEQNKG